MFKLFKISVRKTNVAISVLAEYKYITVRLQVMFKLKNKFTFVVCRILPQETTTIIMTQTEMSLDKCQVTKLN